MLRFFFFWWTIFYVEVEYVFLTQMICHIFISNNNWPLFLVLGVLIMKQLNTPLPQKNWCNSIQVLYTFDQVFTCKFHMFFLGDFSRSRSLTVSDMLWPLDIII